MVDVVIMVVVVVCYLQREAKFGKRSQISFFCCGCRSLHTAVLQGGGKLAPLTWHVVPNETACVTATQLSSTTAAAAALSHECVGMECSECLNVDATPSCAGCASHSDQLSPPPNTSANPSSNSNPNTNTSPNPNTSANSHSNSKSSDESSTLIDNDHYPVQITADDLLPAIAWVIIQANPPNIDAVLWLCSEFRHTELQHGEESFCLSQISSAVEFCRLLMLLLV